MHRKLPFYCLLAVLGCLVCVSEPGGAAAVVALNDPAQAEGKEGQPVDRPEVVIALLGLIVTGIIFLAWVITLRAKLRQSTALIRAQFEKETRLEAQLRQAQKLEALGRLAGGVAHDFNNLLTVINGCGELLVSKLPERTQEQSLAYDIYRAGQKAAALTSQLLLFSRHRAVPVGPVNLNSVVQEVTKLLRRILPEHIEIDLQLADTLPKIDAENGLLHQIMINLAVNARDAMSNHGCLTVATAMTPEGKVRLTVTDTGHGMDEATQARLFEPFFTTKEVGRGTGLGLATVYGIIQTLHGEIRCHSMVGVGTTFEIDFPSSTSKAMGTAHPSTMSSVLLPPGKRTSCIMLVEDDNEVRHLINNVLSAAGYKVIVAASPREAMHQAAQLSHKVDLLLTDVIMPEMNGRQLAEFLQVQWPNLKILYMSGYTPDDVLEQGVDDASVAFLQKPFTPLMLRAKVEEMINKKPASFDPSDSNMSSATA